jgi:tRNA pseudouridine32 synthase/23S rRNA pseudouridine746 synthase
MLTNAPEIDIVYDDADIVIINKPGGLLSIPGRGEDKQDCVTRRLQSLYPDMIEQPSVHRLDMYTSGLMIIAITREAHRDLSKQFQNRKVIKEYTALLEGLVTAESGEIHLPFRVDLDNRPYQIYDPVHGKMGSTIWQRLAYENKTTRILFSPLTGRTHQLRLHASHHLGLGCPIVGDSLYGSGKDGDQMMLHASHLVFTHPGTGQSMTFSSPPPF